MARSKHNKPSLIILDLKMPDMDGFEVIRQLKKSDLTKDIPIIIVSGKKLNAEEREFLTSKIESILIKGNFKKQDLLQDIKKMLTKLAQQE